MKCNNCGYEFAEGIFCPECGSKYDEERAKKIAEELKIQEEQRRQEEKEIRVLELEKAKVEQERLAAERAAHEAELARQKNELRKAEEEKEAKAKEDEAKHQEELSRTFNGVLYDSVEEMTEAQLLYEKEVAAAKAIKSTNTFAIWCLILSIATWPLIATFILWFPSLIVSIVFGVKALKEKTTKKKLVIAGFIIDGLFILLCVFGIIAGIKG